jgi:hypothetical protein
MIQSSGIVQRLPSCAPIPSGFVKMSIDATDPAQQSGKSKIIYEESVALSLKLQPSTLPMRKQVRSNCLAITDSGDVIVRGSQRKMVLRRHIASSTQ